MAVLSRGSVVVTSDLWFNQPIGPKEAETQLKAGLQAAGHTELVIDSDRILITGEIPELARHRKRSQIVFNVNVVSFVATVASLGFRLWVKQHVASPIFFLFFTLLPLLFCSIELLIGANAKQWHQVLLKKHCKKV